jgi:peptide/nickel transport system substrate-binding protein
MIVGGCAPSQAPRAVSGEEAAPGQGVMGPKRITAAILGDPYTLSQAINSAGTGSVRGVGEVEKLIHAGLVIVDADGNLRPQLAVAVPSIENGNWRVSPDGRMETSWTLRPDARWHDGTAVTSADLAFTLQIAMDRELALPGHPAIKVIDGLSAADDRTITLKWKRPYIEADRVFSSEFALPLPRHRLEASYAAEKASFLELPHWTREFVGAGPYKLKDFVRSSHLVLEPFDQYLLGRPKIAEIVVKFLQDPNVLIANLLAGEIEMSMGRGLSIEQALQVGAQWPQGRVDSKPSNWIAHYPQALAPNPPALGDVRFRRALLQALDRQQMSDALQGGLAPVAHAWLEYGAPEFKDVEPFVVKLEYDPRRASQTIEELGYRLGPDGMFQDASGQKLRVEARTNAGDDVKDKILFSSADAWQRIGVGVDVLITPRQLASDREYRATYPGFDLVRQPFEPERFHSSEAPLPENRFNGKNRTRYMSADLDSYIDRYLTTIPRAERIQALALIMRHVSENVLALGTLYAPEPLFVSQRLLNVAATKAPNADETWNAHEWDVR